MPRTFELIPVIDLMGGVVVHARAGERDSYRPLVSRLSPASAPLDVVAGLMALHPFRRLYIADLDAIRKTGGHAAEIADLGRRFPGLELWVDAGFAGLEACRSFLAAGAGALVLGSESQADTAALTALGGEPRLILSLDFKADTPLGPAAIHERPELWPARVIVMTLAAVGGAAGPDLARLRAVRAAAGDRAVFAAGGVRGAADLALLAEEGCAGVLIASALHDGRLGRKELERFEH